MPQAGAHHYPAGELEELYKACSCKYLPEHIGIDPAHIHDLASEDCNTTPCMMPYVTSFFEPRRRGDRPDVVPAGSVNLAFIGQYAETPRDTVFTTEYSIRTGMEAVYTLCDVDRGVPEVWGSVYDLRDLLRSIHMLSDGKRLDQMDLDLKTRVKLQGVLKELRGTEAEKLLREVGLI